MMAAAACNENGPLIGLSLGAASSRYDDEDVDDRRLFWVVDGDFDWFYAPHDAFIATFFQ